MATSNDPSGLPPAHESRFWHLVLSGVVNHAPHPLMRRIRARDPKVPIEEFVIVGRRSGTERHYLLNHIQVDGHRYVGHPDGASQWVRNLAACHALTMIDRAGNTERLTATEIDDGPERDAVIRWTGTMPAPAGRIYGAAAGHIRAAGRFFRVTPES
jgi:hypothetical protein